MNEIQLERSADRKKKNRKSAISCEFAIGGLHRQNLEPVTKGYWGAFWIKALYCNPLESLRITYLKYLFSIECINIYVIKKLIKRCSRSVKSLNSFYLPKKIFNILLPIFLSIPPFVVGIPVFLAILFLAPDMPSNRFHENENP